MGYAINIWFNLSDLSDMVGPGTLGGEPERVRGRGSGSVRSTFLIM